MVELILKDEVYAVMGAVMEVHRTLRAWDYAPNSLLYRLYA